MVSFLWTPTANVHVTNILHVDDSDSLEKGQGAGDASCLIHEKWCEKWHMDIYAAAL